MVLLAQGTTPGSGRAAEAEDGWDALATGEPASDCGARQSSPCRVGGSAGGGDGRPPGCGAPLSEQMPTVAGWLLPFPSPPCDLLSQCSWPLYNLKDHRGPNGSIHSTEISTHPLCGADTVVNKTATPPATHSRR